MEVGQALARVCGIHRLANQNYKIEPRNAEDIILGKPVVRGFSADDGFVRVGPAMTARTAQGQPIQIQLSSAAPEDGQRVLLTSQQPAVINAPPEPPCSGALCPLTLRASAR